MIFVRIKRVKPVLPRFTSSFVRGLMSVIREEALENKVTGSHPKAETANRCNCPQMVSE